MPSMTHQIVAATQLPQPKIAAALALFDEGATLPFIARYRKERTGNLDEVQLRQIQALIRKIGEIDQRRSSILDILTKQGQLTNALRLALENATQKAVLEDLYAPYKQGRKTRGDKARDAGLEPLAQHILRQPPQGSVHGEARRYLRGVLKTTEEALQGARDIVAETLAADPHRRALVRRVVEQHGELISKLKRGKIDSNFRNYQDFRERVRSIPSHRYLAVCRGESAGVLSVKVRPDVERLVAQVTRGCRVNPGSPFRDQLRTAVEDATKRLLLPAGERSVRRQLKLSADTEAIQVFEKNLEALLLAAPLGPQRVLGIDPGIRTGCKCAMIDDLGNFVAYKTIHLVGQVQRDLLLAFIDEHGPSAIAVGNGTGGREAEAIVRETMQGRPIVVVSVNEAGASVYSASELAGEELPDVDLTVRGAVSIARRLQDPLAELVKVDPSSLGVGQYQHDVDQGELHRKLHEVVESCVNRVGVNLNTASPALLRHVAGLGDRLARAIVVHRQVHGRFTRRRDLLQVSGLGAKTYEQCAGFLRIPGGPDPLDDSGVHPERYDLVARMLRDLHIPLSEAVGSPRLKELDLTRYQDKHTGRATLQHIVEELDKPGRDPRAAFEPPAFRDDIRTLADIESGLVLPGVVTNVTNFGAFVDLGVHQDGLVHISELANRFVHDPHEVVHPGMQVEVLVLNVDAKRKRIALSIKQASTT